MLPNINSQNSGLCIGSNNVSNIDPTNALMQCDTTSQMNIYSIGKIMLLLFENTSNSRILKLIRACCNADPSKRPKAIDIVSALKEPNDIIPGVDFISFSLYLDSMDAIFPSQRRKIVTTTKLLSETMTKESAFEVTEMIGEGSFATVYKAIVDDSKFDSYSTYLQFDNQSLKSYESNNSDQCNPIALKNILKDNKQNSLLNAHKTINQNPSGKFNLSKKVNYNLLVSNLKNPLNKINNSNSTKTFNNENEQFELEDAIYNDLIVTNNSRNINSNNENVNENLNLSHDNSSSSLLSINSHSSNKSNLTINNFVALKKYDNRIKSDKYRQIYLLREIEIIHSMNHPAIVKMKGHNILNLNFEYNKDSNGNLAPFLALEFLENGSLKDILKRPNNFFNATDKMKTLYGIASALEYMHTRPQRIIHRDLKLDNIMFDSNKEPKICDFNQSKRTDKYLMDASAMFGTPLYCAPELQITACNSKNFEDKYSPSVDIFSFGMIMFRIVTGHKPFFKFADKKILSKIRNKERPDDEIDCFSCHEIVKLIKSCWAHDPEQRPTATEIVRILRNLNHKDLIEGANYNQYMEYVRKIDIATRHSNHVENPDFNLSGHIIKRSKFTNFKSKKSFSNNIDYNLPNKLGNDDKDLFLKTRSNIFYLVTKKGENDHLLIAKQMKNNDFQNQKSFIREIETLVRVNHPGIVKLIGFDLFSIDKNNKPVIFMEYLENGCLNDKFLSKNSISSTLKMMIIFLISSVLNHLHHLGIVHGDLKPSDILFDSDFKPKICNFNSSIQINSVFDNSLLCEKSKFEQEFVAPELFANNEEIRMNDKCDIFSFGAICKLLISEQNFTHNFNSNQEKSNLVKLQNNPKIDSKIDFDKKNKNIIKTKFENENECKNHCLEGMQSPLIILINKCLDSNPSNRPTASEIMTNLIDEEFWLPDVDKAKILSFFEEMKPIPKIIIPKEPQQPHSRLHHSPRANTSRAMNLNVDYPFPQPSKNPNTVRPKTIQPITAKQVIVNPRILHSIVRQKNH
ncbi:hypothetical protein TRFO_34833 [Tritrichomonas foetus]|uniref:Protein kinase domain-containing protein n=1 Tax=Tritrichomonas foetus TaxID=1144522 RepID=A0A1J4JHU6_9EUKA|nr:hypothetical protein TRFO_34833 [Tritrichomonas foetus]|eukprot:OHS98686.1 hypothetical protein TRFO_34833 [Tritrichomonas foetus]